MSRAWTKALKPKNPKPNTLQRKAPKTVDSKTSRSEIWVSMTAFSSLAESSLGTKRVRLFVHLESSGDPQTLNQSASLSTNVPHRGWTAEELARLGVSQRLRDVGV